jgi:Transposase, Mutator family
VPATQAFFEQFASEWRAMYPAMITSWERTWDEFVPFLEFPVELRKIVYTSDAIESMNARFNRAVRHRGAIVADVNPIDVPDLMRQRVSSNGAAGARWLADLPDVVADLSRRWGLTLGAAFSGGTAGYVVEATDSSGRACVLKITMPPDIDEHDSFVRSVRAHELAAGKGCAELLTPNADRTLAVSGALSFIDLNG